MRLPAGTDSLLLSIQPVHKRESKFVISFHKVEAQFDFGYVRNLLVLFTEKHRQKVAFSIHRIHPGRVAQPAGALASTPKGCRFGPWSGLIQGAMGRCFSHISVSLSLALSLSLLFTVRRYRYISHSTKAEICTFFHTAPIRNTGF